MAVLNPIMGVQAPFTSFGSQSSISATTFAVDDAFVFATSGKAIIYRFACPVTQSSASLTVYVYATAKTGTPTSQTAFLHGPPTGADDDDRPNSTVIDTSAVVDASAITFPSWVTYTFSAATLTVGQTYFIIVTNTTATPASNYVTYLGRPQNFLSTFRINGFTTIDGIASDPVNISSASEPPIVLKFSDSTIMGNPYVISTSHASSTVWRGARFQYDTDIEVAGFATSLGSTVVLEWRVYQGSTLLETITPDKNVGNNGGTMYFSSQITFEGGVAYDIVVQPASNSTIGARSASGASAPADVVSAQFSQMGFVTGATPGSFTYTPGEFTSIILLPNNIPEVAGGSGGGFFIS